MPKRIATVLLWLSGCAILFASCNIHDPYLIMLRGRGSIGLPIIALIVAGFLPLTYLGLKNVGGWSGLKAALGPSYTHSWAGMSHANTNRLGVEWFGLVMGLAYGLNTPSYRF